MENQIEIYKSPDNKIELQVQFDKDTVWLSQGQMTDFFAQAKLRNLIISILNRV